MKAGLRTVCFFATFLLFSCSGPKSAVSRQGGEFINKVIAHRGAHKNTGLPENSIAALLAAIRLGCGGSEFDIHMTADSVLVINHDHTFQGLNIETTTYPALLEKTLPNGEKIPTLESYLAAGLQQQRTRLIAEIKPSKVSKERSLVLAGKVVAMVQQLDAARQTVYISFDYDILKKVKELDPAAPVQYLRGDVGAEQLKTDGIDADYHYSIFQKDTGWIRHARSIGLRVNAWTVNDAAVMDNLLAQDIDFITTDEPELLLKKFKEINETAPVSSQNQDCAGFNLEENRGTLQRFRYTSERIKGNLRIRFPVRSKMALHRAGANAGRPGSPTPPAGSSFSMMCTAISGISCIRGIR